LRRDGTQSMQEPEKVKKKRIKQENTGEWRPVEKTTEAGNQTTSPAEEEEIERGELQHNTRRIGQGGSKQKNMSCPKGKVFRS